MPVQAVTGERQELADANPHVVREGADATDGEFVRFESTMYPASAGDGTDLSHEPWGIDNDFEHSESPRISIADGL